MSTQIATLSDIKKVDMGQLKAESIGLSLLLFNNAKLEGRRAQSLSSSISKLEELIFDESIYEMLSPDELMERYKLAVQMQQLSLNYVKAVTDTVNLDDISTKILLLENQVQEVDENFEESDIQDTARRLLSQMRPTTD